MKTTQDYIVSQTVTSIRQTWTGTINAYIKRQADILCRVAAGETQVSVAKRYGLHPGTVQSILARRDRWTNPDFCEALKRRFQEVSAK